MTGWTWLWSVLKMQTFHSNTSRPKSPLQACRQPSQQHIPFFILPSPGLVFAYASKSWRLDGRKVMKDTCKGHASKRRLFIFRSQASLHHCLQITSITYNLLWVHKTPVLLDYCLERRKSRRQLSNANSQANLKTSLNSDLWCNLCSLPVRNRKTAGAHPLPQGAEEIAARALQRQSSRRLC